MIAAARMFKISKVIGRNTLPPAPDVTIYFKSHCIAQRCIMHKKVLQFIMYVCTVQFQL